MIEVVNRQKYRKIDTKRWKAFTAMALEAVGARGQDATIAFISSRRMRELNKRYRNLNKSTDVLSFPASATDFDREGTNLGEIAIAVDHADKQARDNGLEFNQEIAQLILHGLLHLCGYDHETDNGQMNRLERRLRKKLQIEDVD